VRRRTIAVRFSRYQSIVGRVGSFFIRVIMRMFFSVRLALASLVPMRTVTTSGCRWITESRRWSTL
jgi:hypothetical protein